MVTLLLEVQELQDKEMMEETVRTIVEEVDKMLMPEEEAAEHHKLALMALLTQLPK